MGFSGDERKNYGAYLKERGRAVKAAQEYFGELPMGLGSYDYGKGGRLEVAYQLPSPEAHHASYWPHKRTWKYNVKSASAKSTRGKTNVYYHDTRLRQASSPEDFARQFAPGSFAPDSLRFQASLPARLLDFYEGQGGRALADAVERGEFDGWSSSINASPTRTGAPPSTDELTEETAGETRPEGTERGDGPGDPGAGQPRADGHAEAPYNRGASAAHGAPDQALAGRETASVAEAGKQKTRKRSAPAEGPEQAQASKAFMLKNARVFAAHLAAVDRILMRVGAPVSEETRRFFWHVYITGEQAEHGPRVFVPVSAKLIERELGEHSTGKVWQPLLDAGLVDWRWENKQAHLSRRFAVRQDVRDEVEATTPRAGDPAAVRFVDPFTRRAATSQADKRHVRDSNDRPHAPLIREALAELRREGCPADLVAAQTYVDELDAEHRRASGVWRAEGSPASGPLYDALETAKGRLRTDQYCLRTILQTVPEPLGVGVWRCVPWYNRDPQSAGRITEIGGLQNCSKRMRHAALAGLRESHDVRNYDLVSSQAWGLVQMFEDAGVSTDWLRAYLAADKAIYAERAFGDRSEAAVDVWKRCLLALVMGATMPTTTGWRPAHADGRPRAAQDIAVLIRDAFGGGTASPDTKLASFRSVVRPLLKDREAWYDWLSEGVGPKGKLAKPGSGGWYVKNAVGVTLKVNGLSGFELNSKLSAHLLQGVEAAFVHRLTALGPAFGFSAVNNQHDGLLTVGAIPQAAVERAQADSGLRYATLKEKRYHADLPVPGLAEDKKVC